MATLREYFEKSFSHYLKVNIKTLFENEYLGGNLLYDFAGFHAFLALYVDDSNKDLNYFIRLLSNIQYGVTELQINGSIYLPIAMSFPGQIKVENKQILEIKAQYFGDTGWISNNEIPATTRIFIFSESDLTKEEIIILKKEAKKSGHDLQFRSQEFVRLANKFEKPLAFISHDSRDKDIAKEIATKLQSMLCPVWYDEFRLKVGDSLRESIEKGLKDCKKCILILSKNFISNNGWTKKEFDSIFTREIVEGKKLILPVWYGVTRDEVSKYSLSLANVVGKKWEGDKDKICQELHKAILT